MKLTLPRRAEFRAPASRTAACLAFCIAITAAAPQTRISAQTLQSAPPAAPPTLKVYARETVVDVTVTDAKGNPVHGLTQSDFTIKEDGKPQPIHSFEEFGPNPDADSFVLPNLPPDTYTDLQPPPASSAVNILLLDGLNTAPPDGSDGLQLGWSFAIQTRVKQGAEKFLNNMPTGTRVAVLGLSRNLRILQGVASDPALLSAAVETMEMNTDGRATTISEWCNQQNSRNRATLEALNQIAADVTAIKGKKNLIWFSAGFPTVTDARINADAARGCLPDYTQDLLKTYGLLAAAQVNISPIGARIFGTQIASPVGPGVVDQTSPAYMEYVADEQASLESIAEATGGTAFYNTNDLAAAAAQAVDKAANYYTLSYVPPGQKYDYGHHSIKVELNPAPPHPGLHLIYRQTYDAIDPATIKPATGLTLATALPTAGPGIPIDMRLAMGRAMPTSTQLIFNVHVEPSPMPPLTAGASPQPILGTLDPAVKAKLKGKR